MYCPCPPWKETNKRKKQTNWNRFTQWSSYEIIAIVCFLTVWWTASLLNVAVVKCILPVISGHNGLSLCHLLRTGSLPCWPVSRRFVIQANTRVLKVWEPRSRFNWASFVCVFYCVIFLSVTGATLSLRQRGPSHHRLKWSLQLKAVIMHVCEGFPM